MSMQPEIKKAEVLSGISFIAKNAVECKVNIKEEETLEEICAQGRVSINYIDCQNGEVRYGGKVVFSISYGVNELKKAEVGVEFSYKTQVEGVMEGDYATADCWLENQDDEILKESVSLLHRLIKKCIEAQSLPNIDQLLE